MTYGKHEVCKIWDVLGPMLATIPTLKYFVLGVVTAPVITLLLNSIKGIKHFEVGNKLLNFNLTVNIRKTDTFRVWRVIILSVRAKSVGPVRVKAM